MSINAEPHRFIDRMLVTGFALMIAGWTVGLVLAQNIGAALFLFALGAGATNAIQADKEAN